MDSKNKLSELISELQELKSDNACDKLKTSDINKVLDEIAEMKRSEILEAHPYKIWFCESDKKYHTYVQDDIKGRKLLKRKTEEELEEALYKYYKNREIQPTIETVFNEWIDNKLKFGEIRKQSYDRYKSDFDRFFMRNPKFKDFGKRKIRYIDEDDIEEFIKMTIVSMQLTQKAYSNMRTLINGIFKHAKKKKLTTLSITNCMGDIEISKNSFKKNTKSKETEVYQEGEIELLTSYLASQKDCIRCQGLLLIFETGVRVGELCSLKPEDVSKKKYVHVQRTEIKVKDENGKWKLQMQEYTKSDAGERYIVVNEKASDTIDNIMRIRFDGEYLFMENGRLLHSNSFRRKLMRVCDSLGIDYKSNHKIRKTYGTMLIDGNVDEAIIAEQMGHADITTTKKYYYYSNKNEHKKIEQISNAIAF